MENREQNGTAYVVVSVKELGNNVPSLVPYDYSSEEEREQTPDHSNQCSQHHVKSNVESESDSESPKSDSSGMSEAINFFPADDPDYDDLVLKTSDDESDSAKKNRMHTDSDEDYVPGSPRGYSIWTTDETYDVSFCHDILKDNGCSESSYLFHSMFRPGCFFAKLHKEELEKLKGDSRVHQIYPMDTHCCVA